MSFQVFIDGNPGFFRYFGMIFYFFLNTVVAVLLYTGRNFLN